MSTLGYESVAVGDPLPVLEVDLTPTLIVSTAIATRDYQEVHHDRDLAIERGSKDIFMNILSTNGFVSRFVTEWAGPEAIIKRIRFRLGAPNYPYDKMTMTGRVESKADESAEIEVSVCGANGLGDHVRGSVRLALPRVSA